MIKGALSIKPDYAEAHNNLGFTFQTFGRLDEAIIPVDKRPIVK